MFRLEEREEWSPAAWNGAAASGPPPTHQIWGTEAPSRTGPRQSSSSTRSTAASYSHNRILFRSFFRWTYVDRLPTARPASFPICSTTSVWSRPGSCSDLMAVAVTMVGSLRRAVVLKITIGPSSADIASRASEDGGSWKPSNPGNLRMDAKVSSISTMACTRSGSISRGCNSNFPHGVAAPVVFKIYPVRFRMDPG